MEPKFFYLGSLLLIAALTLLAGFQRDIESSGTTRVELRITDAPGKFDEINLNGKKITSGHTIVADGLKNKVVGVTRNSRGITLRKKNVASFFDKEVY